MSTISDIREGLKNCLENPATTNLPAYASAVDDPQIPSATVFLDEPVWEPDTMNNGAITYHFIITVLAGRTAEAASQTLLDGFMSTQGHDTIRNAIAADPTLSGVCSYAFVSRARGYQSYTAAGVEYLGVQFHVDVRV